MNVLYCSYDFTIKSITGKTFSDSTERSMMSTGISSHKQLTFHILREYFDRTDAVFLLLYGVSFCQCSQTPNLWSDISFKMLMIFYWQVVVSVSLKVGIWVSPSEPTRNKNTARVGTMETVVGAMWWPHTSWNIEVSLSQHSQPSTVNSKHNFRKKRKFITKVKITYLNNEQQHLFKYI